MPGFGLGGLSVGLGEEAVRHEVTEALTRARAAPLPRATPPADGRLVPVTSLLIAYSHTHVGELVLGGMEPREAFTRCWYLFYQYLLPETLALEPAWPTGVEMLGAVAAGFAAEFTGPLVGAGPSKAGLRMQRITRGAVWPLWENAPEDAMEVEPMPPGKNWTHTCFVRAAAENSAVLAGATPRRSGKLAVFVAPDEADRLVWMLEMMRRFASGGGPLAACARGAVDQAAGRPRRRRAPADEDWLAGEITEALEGCWGLLAAVVRRLPSRRPVMDGR